MKFQTHNDKEIPTCGTHLVGEIRTTYAKLVELFGEPTEGDGYKVDAEWEIEFENGTVVTIYNWKNGKNYCGADGLNVRQITNWNIGGHGQEAFDSLSTSLQKK